MMNTDKSNTFPLSKNWAGLLHYQIFVPAVQDWIDVSREAYQRAIAARLPVRELMLKKSPPVTVAHFTVLVALPPGHTEIDAARAGWSLMTVAKSMGHEFCEMQVIDEGGYVFCEMQKLDPLIGIEATHAALQQAARPWTEAEPQT